MPQSFLPMASPDPVAISLHPAAWQADRVALESIRRQVFVVEQGVPEAEEWDERDPLCRHVVARLENCDVVGTGRLDPVGKIGRIAVLDEYRGKGVGAAIVMYLIEQAHRDGLGEVYLYAQVSALGFYKKLGFSPVGPEFDEVGIPHRRMNRAVGMANEQRVGFRSVEKDPHDP
jgi:predicted GNAT family N-acyltransferase